MWKYWLFRFASFLAGHVPVRTGYRLAVVFSELYYRSVGSQRQNAMIAMRHVFGPHAPESQVRWYARRSFHNYARLMLDFIRFPYLTHADIKRMTISEGWEHLDAALAEGHGAILVSTHFGNWDMAGAIIGVREYRTHIIVDSFDPPALDRLIQDTRLRNGVNIVPAKGALRKIYQALKRNEVVGLLIDRPEPGGGIPVRFLGGTAYLPTGPAAIALRAGSKILHVYCYRQPGDETRFHGVIEPPLEYELTGERGHDIQAVTQAIVNAMERPIRRFPEQWYLFRKMWDEEDPASTEPARKRRDDADLLPV